MALLFASKSFEFCLNFVRLLQRDAFVLNSSFWLCLQPFPFSRLPSKAFQKVFEDHADSLVRIVQVWQFLVL